MQVVLSLNPGGTERLVVELARRLKDEIPMAVCCLEGPGAWAAEIESQGIAVFALNWSGGFQPGLGRAVAGAAKKHDASALHAHHYSPFVYSALARVWRPGLRVIFTEHGRLSDAPPSAKRKVANALLSKMPSRVFTVSADLKRHIAQEGFPAGDIGVIYNGIDIGPLPAPADRDSVRRELGVTEDTLVVAAVARLDPVKDLGVLIESTKEVAASRPVLALIIGDGSERATLEARAADLGVAKNVRFLGHRDDARRWLAGCDVYVNCSISEGISLTILEAMAAGLPSVVTRVGGTPEIIDDSCGRLIPARDPGSLTAALLALAAAPDLRHTLGRTARARVEERFTLDRMVAEYRDVYLKVGQ